MNLLGRIFFLLIIVGGTMISSCAEEKKEQKNGVEDFKQELEDKRISDSILIANIPKPDSNLITNNNVVDKLTKFGRENPENKVRINTKYGSVEILLYDDTPLHRANFLMLIKKNYFDSTLFYRIVNGFMIQGGNSDRDEVPLKMKEIGSYTIPDEILPHHSHKRGALAMAVSEQLDTPDEEKNKFSSPNNFYIVQNGPLSENYLKNVIKKYKLDLSNSEKQLYRNKGGAPHLDGDYTVFGEVINGFEVIDKIASFPTDKNERPLVDITLSIEIIE